MIDHNVPNYAAITSSSESSASASSSSASSSSRHVSSNSTLFNEEVGLPPPDTGRQAWLFLFGCFWLEGLVWGLPFSYGVFEQYYSTHEPFASEAGVAAIGTTGLGFAYFLAPFMIFILQRWPARRKQMSVGGLIVITIAMMSASFAQHTLDLVFTQGLMYGVGGAMLYNPFIFYLDEWFVERKGLAYGIFWAGTGLCSSAMPFLMDWALLKYGFRNTLRAWAAFVFITLAALIYLVRPRKPLPAEGVTQGLNLRFLKTTLFWAFEVGNIIEGLGYFVPQVFLPTFAHAQNLPQIAQTLSVSLLNISSTIGLIFMGYLIDKFHISTVLLISALTSTFVVFVFWGWPYTSQATLYLFAILFGIFAGGYTASWTGCATEVKKADEYFHQHQTPTSPGQSPDHSNDNTEREGVEIAVVMGTLAAGRGFGCVLCGPIAEALLELPTPSGKGVWGTKYAWLILFTGLTSLLGRFGLFGKRLGMHAAKSADGRRGEGYKGKGKGKARESGPRGEMGEGGSGERESLL